MELLFLLLISSSFLFTIVHAQQPSINNKSILESLGTLSPVLYHHIQSLPKSDFADLLSQHNNSITFFLPNEAALNASLQSGALNFSIDPHNALTFLTLPNAYSTTTFLASRKFYTTLSPQKFQMSIGPDNTTVKIYAGVTESHIVTKDITCSNGVIHIIDKLLQPPLDPLSTISFLTETEVMEGLLKSLNISDTISGPNKTILAPTDGAWNAVNGAQLPFGTLVHNLKYMVLDGVALSEQLPGRFVSNYKGALVSIDAHGSVNNGQARIVLSNMLTTQGVIHVIDKVLSADDESKNETSSSPPAAPSPAGANSSNADHGNNRIPATAKSPFPLKSQGCNRKTGYWMCSSMTVFVMFLFM